jgi:hypothetical protein
MGPPAGGPSVKYQSGQEIRKGDKVLLHGEPGEIEFVVERLVGDPAMDWHMREQGQGVMVLEPKQFGRAYIRDTENAEDLKFISRA